MMKGKPQSPGHGRHLVITADDFGRSSSINKAVAAACDSGILTAASIMAGGDAFEEAVALAATHPQLSVGLHVTLSDGRPVFSPAHIPDLVNGEGSFDKSPMRAGIAYWRLRRRLEGQIEKEVKAQFDKVEEAGIHPTHVDCHHHLHMHPVLFDIIAKEAAGRHVAWIRIPREPWSLVWGLRSPYAGLKTFPVSVIFGLLACRNAKTARRWGLKTADNVYGLSGTGRMDEGYLLSLLSYIKRGVSEIYLHPDSGSLQGFEEMKAVTSLLVRKRLEALSIRLTGFQNLSTGPSHRDAVTGCVAYGH